jgi:pimeloyl-ACP methyl ester carboxylesterase
VQAEVRFEEEVVAGPGSVTWRCRARPCLTCSFAMVTDERSGTGGPAPRLIRARTPSRPSAVVLVLHGGGGRGAMPVSPTQLSVLRMIPIARQVAKAGHGRLAVFRLLNAVRGMSADPLSNVRWALSEVRQSYPTAPVMMVGHSLGGSVALAAAGQAGVVGVAALAPWLSGSESVSQLGAGHTLVVHGDRDRVTSCRASESYAAAARRTGAAVSFVRVRGGEHTMLRRMPAFDVLAAHYVHAVLDPGHAIRPSRWFGPLTAELDELARTARDRPGDYEI